MKGYITNIEQATLENKAYRRVLYTARNCQLVLMSIEPGDEIGEEMHELDQFIRVEAGNGTAILADIEHEIADGMALVIPAGLLHNVVNTGDTPLKLYSVYAPPEHKDGTVHETKAEEDEEHWDGSTTE
jgi:mannose-6-phosphate isomerase-like protein (cupin superfamily)